MSTDTRTSLRTSGEHTPRVDGLPTGALVDGSMVIPGGTAKTDAVAVELLPTDIVHTSASEKPGTLAGRVETVASSDDEPEFGLEIGSLFDDVKPVETKTRDGASPKLGSRDTDAALSKSPKKESPRRRSTSDSTFSSGRHAETISDGKKTKDKVGSSPDGSKSAEDDTVDLKGAFRPTASSEATIEALRAELLDLTSGLAVKGATGAKKKGSPSDEEAVELDTLLTTSLDEVKKTKAKKSSSSSEEVVDEAPLHKAEDKESKAAAAKKSSSSSEEVVDDAAIPEAEDKDSKAKAAKKSSSSSEEIPVEDPDLTELMTDEEEPLSGTETAEIAAEERARSPVVESTRAATLSGSPKASSDVRVKSSKSGSSEAVEEADVEEGEGADVDHADKSDPEVSDVDGTGDEVSDVDSSDEEVDSSDEAEGAEGTKKPQGPKKSTFKTLLGTVASVALVIIGVLSAVFAAAAYATGTAILGSLFWTVLVSGGVSALALSGGGYLLYRSAFKKD